MLARLNQISQHCSRRFVDHTRSVTFPRLASKAMTSSPEERSKCMIHTAACLIIGDEVLGGKTTDTNSAYLAKYCFSLGIQLKRIEVIADDEDEIGEATRRMSEKYDFVVTSGGIGPTHDDITYQSISKAFGLPLKLHNETLERMKKLSKPHPSQPNFSWDEPSPALEAKLRMVRLPFDESREEKSQILFVDPELWVPICVVNGNIHILPGIPRLFTQLLTGLKARLIPRLTDPEGKGVHRITISTPMAESQVAGYLTELAAIVESTRGQGGQLPSMGQKKECSDLSGARQASTGQPYSRGREER